MCFEFSFICSVIAGDPPRFFFFFFSPTPQKFQQFQKVINLCLTREGRYYGEVIIFFPTLEILLYKENWTPSAAPHPLPNWFIHCEGRPWTAGDMTAGISSPGVCRFFSLSFLAPSWSPAHFLRECFCCCCVGRERMDLGRVRVLWAFDVVG